MSLNQKILFAPSVLAADLAHLAADIHQAEKAGADVLHIDIMDGNFVPNITFGPGFVKTLDQLTDLPLDVHLMIVEPQKYLADFARAGADSLTVHMETCPHIHRVLEEIRSLKIKTGISLNPGTSLSLVEEVWPDLDILLLMTVNPGFGGQAFLPEMLPKIRRLRAICAERDLHPIIEVDGGENAATAAQAAAAGATAIVAGAAIFGSSDYAAAIASIRTKAGAAPVRS
jgi:ribulose-phosphate 3-epimerase